MKFVLSFLKEQGYNPLVTFSASASLAMRYRSPPGDDVAIMSYANLAQTTQERIKRFEEETKAMLERDLYRQNRDSQQWDEQRKQIERQWLQAKEELEADDALDSVISVTSGGSSSVNCLNMYEGFKNILKVIIFLYLSAGVTDQLRVDSVRSLLSSTSSSGSATPPQRSSWRVGWGSRLSSTSNTSNSASSLIAGALPNQSDAQNNGHLKRMKTGKEPVCISSTSLGGFPNSLDIF